VVFNLCESFNGDDTAGLQDCRVSRADWQEVHGFGHHGLMLAQDKAIAKKIFAFHGIHTPTLRNPFADASIFRTTSSSRSS
jgi:D-alanine-D-alanine ligase